ncbi:MAG: BamA/TamA family outer membrane protein [Prevotella sp.]|nr:BamA/TamA family outer membrane protein [Prevotella sp.]
MKTIPAITRFLLSSSAIFLVVALAGCGSTKSIPEGSYVLDGVAVECADKGIDGAALSEYVRQKPATKIFSLIRKPGAKPVVYDTLLANQSAADIEQAVRNLGYLHAKVDISNAIASKPKVNKVRTRYVVDAGEPYFIRSFAADIQDPFIDSLITLHAGCLRPLAPGSPLSVYALGEVREAVTGLLLDNGYWRFNKDYVDFTIDTLAQSTAADVTMSVYMFRPTRTAANTLHTQYRLRDITFSGADNQKLHLRRRVLENNTALRSGELYSASALRKTYNNFARLQAVRYTNIAFSEVPDSSLLDCNILLSTNKPSSLSIQPEGTNTAGDFGAALILAYENNNLFRGSELLTVEGRVAYEAIRGLEGYSDQDYQEYGIETKLTFPRFMIPSGMARRRSFSNLTGQTTEFALSYNLQNRPEFHRRLFSGVWRYRWSNQEKNKVWRFDLIDLNYIYMPWISETFREDYLDNSDSRNAILRYNYEDLFIMKIGLGLTVSRKDYSLRTNIETAGNLLHALAAITSFPTNADGQHTLFHIAYAQYVKGDVEYTRNISFDENNQLVLHGALGIAYPYGNSTILPFEKRYFAGGANSVRGWSVRSLGPGSFHGKDGRIDFINQTGDIRLDLNAEYRTKLFWKFHLAAFIDAGNIWTIRNYDDQAGGQFRFNEFYKQLAAAYGLGVRLYLGYFILRFDFGMKAVNPDYTTKKQHFPIYHPRLDRDLAVHFAVGLPF